MTLSVSLNHRLPGFTLDLSFEAPPGLTALFGRSGAGKTTVVNAVAGLVTPERGRIVADDGVLLDTAAGVNLPPHRRRVGYVFQDARLFPHLTVRQNLLYGRFFAPKGAGADLARIVDLLGIAALLGRRPGALSGGERQRVAIGRAILSNPRMLLLDEPLAALDEARKAEILPYLERLRDELGLPMLYVSHAMSEVARLATTVVLMEAGRVTAAGPTAAILSDPAAATGLGLREAGAVLDARVAAQEADGLTRLETGAGPLWLPQIDARDGALLRLRILAQDVMLATQRPQGVSALNILPATVRDIRIGDGPGALVRLTAGEETILARITRRSVDALGLEAGRPVYAVLKAVSVARENVGQTGQIAR
ncbi:molybdenum ABC transporter ATP-binding protein [Albidovulum sp.]|uniref:molybdenum ABC transporter ATP-binding protein n=1 Tax=Albidovulum sp. TaxID=1872424 RepID=UPI001DD6FF19|nr:molybdenum ABC transporter ATP-binding protein [Paracoccaceae bacterium]HPE26303.1 molybdenum ABC transporter ATP-binding protein [Albidovulum sp.]MCB2158611.1 molybdenum ABC transporter ATP-binding protein [Paracoccaceae bacterium]MCO5126348.1 molybdenum ABC transporter ATP-binding protein [Paracoccaceae bacterium]MCP5353570.1 molybdenum ABC transporter ATP-binding protein [Paracoccaceae bacterium]